MLQQDKSKANNGTNLKGKGRTMKTEKTIRIHKAVGECISVQEYAELAHKIIGVPVDAIVYAVEFIEEELGLVEALDLYSDTVGISNF